VKHVAAEPTDRTLLDRDEALMLDRETHQQVVIEGLDETGIGHGRRDPLSVETLGGGQARPAPRAEGQ